MSNDLDQTEPSAPPLIVGVGGSAGGLEAFQRFIESVPADSRLSIVFILHLLPTHASMLAELISKATALRVTQAQDGVALEAGRVYVIPPDAYIEVRDGRVKLSPRGEGAVFLPIDRFFASLAKDAGERAVGIVLSGMGNDGALGLRQIKEAGGVTFCQSPDTAQHDEMPRAAQATGDADFALSPPEIARALVGFSSHAYLAPPGRRAGANQPRPSESEFQRIFTLLRTASGVDFSYYKRPTIERRLFRRMALHKIDGAAEYIKLLERQPREANELYRDILIHVTFFFREPESFITLAEKAFPKMLAERRPGEALRIWTPGCSTGEEPYSIAIGLLEFLGEKAHEVPVQIFATDISESAIEAARSGLYAEPAVRPVSEERLRRYFTQVDGKYRIDKRVRDLCIFARHDLTRDPPFSRLDLLVCRNVLIYLGQPLQKRLFSAFHYALKPTGFLMLGGAETTGLEGELFGLVDRKHRLYVKRSIHEAPLDLDFLEGARPPRTLTPLAAKPLPDHALRKSVRDEATHLVISKYAPPGVLVNERLEIVQFRGQTGFFLEPSPGEVNLHVLKMARPGLLHELQEALFEARKSLSAVRKEGLHVPFNGHGRDVNIEVTPILVANEPPHFLVLFEDFTAEADEVPNRRSRAGSRAAGEAPSQTETDQTVRELETTRRYLQAAIQDLEITNEELQSANEEVVVEQRGAAEHQRRARHRSRGAAKHQRRAQHAQRRVARPQRRAKPAEQRSDQLAEQRPLGGDHGRSRAVHSALHPAGREAL